MISEERIKELKRGWAVELSMIIPTSLHYEEKLDGYIRTVAAEARKEGIEGKVIHISWINLRPIDGKGPPRYVLRVDTEYETFEEREAEAKRLKE